MEEKYEVEIWSTPMPRPFSFAIHCWFVTRYQGESHRFEVWATLGKFSGNTVVLDALAPEAGFRTSFFDSPTHPKYISKTKKLFSCQGGSHSVAEQLFRVIHKSDTIYPYTKEYRMYPGPNSNTYVAWILAQVPELTCKLPWNAFGTGYKRW